MNFTFWCGLIGVVGVVLVCALMGQWAGMVAAIYPAAMLIVGLTESLHTEAK